MLIDSSIAAYCGHPSHCQVHQGCIPVQSLFPGLYSGARQYPVWWLRMLAPSAVCRADIRITQFVSFSEPHLQFFCLQCIGLSYKDGFNFAASPSRIAACAPVVSAMCLKAASELQFLQFHNIVLPDVRCVAADNVTEQSPSVPMLQDHRPWILDHFVPAAVQGDGNCLFWAVSFALYGDERFHVLLHLITTRPTSRIFLLYSAGWPTFSADFRLAVFFSGGFSDSHFSANSAKIRLKPIFWQPTLTI